jgi:aspartate dehydrogenase
MTRHILIIGAGAIGAYLVRELHRMYPDAALSCIERTELVDSARKRLREIAGSRVEVYDRVAAVPAGVELAVECGGHAAVSQHGEPCLDAGHDLLVASVGSLADQALHDRLVAAAKRNGRKLLIPAGAVAGMDGLAAARLAGIDRVRYTSRKLPLAWKGTHAEKLLDLQAVTVPTEFLRTDARQAATLFPQNANVAATIALAGVGFERTEVSLNADPGAIGNTHLVEVEGPCGTMRIELSNKPFPDNPKTSMLAGLSLLRAIRNRSEAVVV